VYQLFIHIPTPSTVTRAQLLQLSERSLHGLSRVIDLPSFERSIGECVLDLVRVRAIEDGVCAEQLQDPGRPRSGARLAVTRARRAPTELRGRDGK
jgi:hypothetical protein